MIASPKAFARDLLDVEQRTSVPFSSSVIAVINPDSMKDTFRRADLLPIDTDDAIDLVHQNRVSALNIRRPSWSCRARSVVFEIKKLTSDSTGITLPRSETSPSTPRGMFGVFVMCGVRPTFTHLEHVDPERLARPSGTAGFPSCSNQRPGSRINAVEQVFLFYQIRVIVDTPARSAAGFRIGRATTEPIPAGAA